MTWLCEYCKEEFEEYMTIVRHLRTCKARPIKIEDLFEEADEIDLGTCAECKHLSLLPDEYPCNMCIHNESGHRLEEQK